MASGPSDKSRGVALAYAAILGPFGAHRFYAGRTGSGALMACTLGGFGIWYLYDVILVAAGSFRDVEGRLITRWDPEDAGREHRGDLPQEVFDELDALRAEMAELAERVDFAERLLARPAHEESVGPVGPTLR
jgi:TM2 domain-containing membrane protein YozV